MITRFFTIRNHNDVFDAVGQIIKASQEWEVEYKDYATRAKIEIDNLDYATLRRINAQLREQGKISEKEFNDLQKVIKLRNFINHEFFLVDFNKEVEYLDEKLNNIMFLIFEATDVVSNMIERLEGFEGDRPTIFD